MIPGLETVAQAKRQKADLEVAELKMLRFCLGVTRRDRTRHLYIRGTSEVEPVVDKVREEKLSCFEHV